MKVICRVFFRIVTLFLLLNSAAYANDRTCISVTSVSRGLKVERLEFVGYQGNIPVWNMYYRNWLASGGWSSVLNLAPGISPATPAYMIGNKTVRFQFSKC
jgi:hypothetical protein